jgi:hypothetical protein
MRLESFNFVILVGKVIFFTGIYSELPGFLLKMYLINFLWFRAIEDLSRSAR